MHIDDDIERAMPRAMLIQAKTLAYASDKGAAFAA